MKKQTGNLLNTHVIHTNTHVQLSIPDRLSRLRDYTAKFREEANISKDPNEYHSADLRCYSVDSLYQTIKAKVSCLPAAGWDQETPCSRRGPLPDLLPPTERLSRLSSPHRGPPDHAVQLRVRRMAVQLRTIGDEFNAALLRRAVRGHTQSLQRGPTGDVSHYVHWNTTSGHTHGLLRPRTQLLIMWGHTFLGP